MNLIQAAYLLLPAMAMGASAVSVSTPVVQSGTPVYSAPLTFLSKVSPAAAGGATPTGTVTFTVDGLLGAPQPMDAAGSATTGMTFTVGTHSVSAYYNGDGNYLPGASGTLNLTVDKAASWVSMASNPAQLNQPVAIRAAPALMSPATSAATGTVDFTTGGTAIAGCTGVPVQNAVATCNATFSQVGTIAVTANYSGDANSKASAGILQMTVGKVVAGTYVASTADALVYGTPVTISALLLGAPGVAAPTGSISFAMGNASLPPVPVGADGKASLTFPSGSLGPLAAGAYQVAALYSGDDHYQASRSSTLNVTVAKAATTLALTATTTQAGQTTTLKATVSVPGGVAGGTVSMNNGDLAICTGVAVQNGTATCSMKTAQVGTYTINATYSGDANTGASAGSLQLGVSKAAAGISAGYTPAAPAFGLPVTLTAVVTGAEGQAAPTGTVAFTDGAAGLGVGPVGGDGKASVAALLSVGTHSVVAVYSGDANYQAATASAVGMVVGKAATTLALTATPAQVGQTTTLKATVVVAGSGGGAGGTVSMNAGDVAICSGVAVQNGSATCSLKIAQFGTYAISASYSGDANTAASTGSLQFSVSKAAAGISTGYTPAAPVYGAAVTITASVTGAEGQAAPGGTVAFTDGLAALGTAAVGADGRAAVALPLSVGTHSIVAVYSGDANYQGASAAAVSIVVGKAATSTAIAANPAQAGQPVTVRAAVTVVSPGSGTAGGTVDFSNGGKAIAGCTGVAVQNGVAVCSTSLAQLGDYTIAAGYSGDANTGASTATLSISVSKAVAGFYTATSLSAPPFGAPVTVNALLLGAAGVAAPGGTVAFSDGAAALATVPVGADGRASLVLGTAAPLSVGAHSIGAVYSGDANYQTAPAPALNVVVAKAATSVALTSNTAQVGQPLNLKAVITVVTPGNATLGGTVDFSNGGAAIAGCTGIVPQNGTAACNTSLTQLGDFTIVASYNGDANTAPGSATLKLTVGKAAAGIYTASAPAAPVYGVPVSINALLLGATGLAAPTGNVTFSEGTVTLATLPVGADGRASLVLPANSLAPLAAGAHSVVAIYNGDANYGSATATALNVTVAKASTSTVLTASAGGPVTAAVSVVAPGAGAPTGAVQFIQGGTAIGTVVVVQQGSSFVATLPPGSPGGNLWAVYQGDGNFSSSVSVVVTVAAPVQMSIASDHNPATAGQAVTFTVRVSASTGTPGGSVQWSVDGASSGSSALSGGQATFTATTLAVGSHTMAANYAGDAAYAAGTATLQQVVTKSAAALSLTSSASTTVYGQPVTFTAQLGPASSEGTVQFSDGAAAIGPAAMAGGVATLAVANLAVGAHSITAAWAGDANSAAAVSTALAQTVNKAQTGTALSVSGGTWNALVAAVAPGAGSPTGTVKFLNSATNAVLGSAVLSGGGASTAMPSTPDAIVAVYSGDGNFLASTSAPLTPLTAVNAASYALASFAPDELATLFGSNLATATVSATGGPAGSLGGTTVAVTDSAGAKLAALLLFVSPEQVSFLMPAGTAVGPATVVVSNGKGGAASTPIQVARVAPGLFTLNSTGEGAPAGQLVRVHLDSTQEAAQDVAVFDKARNEWVPTPIDLGAATDVVYLLLYGTGIRHYSVTPLCTIGSRPATVAYAGAQGSYAGLDQVNVALPRSLLGAGTVEVKLTVDGAVANSVMLAFR